MCLGASDSSEFEGTLFGIFVLLAGVVFSVEVGFGVFHPYLLCPDSCRRGQFGPHPHFLLLG